MMISQAEIALALAAYRLRPAGHRSRRITAAQRARHRWSAASVLELLGRVALGEPFYRHSRVDDLRLRIAQGSYAVSSEDIVEKLLGRLLVDAASP